MNSVTEKVWRFVIRGVAFGFKHGTVDRIFLSSVKIAPISQKSRLQAALTPIHSREMHREMHHWMQGDASPDAGRCIT